MGEVLKERTERAKGDEELLSVTIANGVIRQIDSEKRNTASEDRSNYKIVKKGDVPYNSMRMWQGAVGNSKYNGIVSPAYTILTPTSEANGKFFMELFKKKSTLQIFQRWSQGLTSDTWNLKYPILSSIQFAIPSVEEQEKIAEYFSSLDHLITLHQRKYFIIYNKLITWEQRKLGEVGTTYAGLSGKTADDFGHGEASFITYMNVFSHPVANSEMVEHVEIDNKQREVQVGDVFFTTSSETPEEVGMSSVLKEKHGVTYLNSFCFGFRPNVKFDLDYLAYMLRSEPTRSQIKILAQGISRFNISKNKMMDINIQVPNLEEQAMVGAYFRNLDHLITLHRRAL